MSLSVSDMGVVAGRGGGMILDAKKISSSDLQVIAGRAGGSGAHIIIKNPSAISAEDIKIIAGRSKGNVIFDFYDE